jgi:hypothetical protein
MNVGWICGFIIGILGIIGHFVINPYGMYSHFMVLIHRYDFVLLMVGFFLVSLSGNTRRY